MREAIDRAEQRKQAAFFTVKEILRRPELVEAVRAGVGRYTRNVDAEMAGTDAVQKAAGPEVFSSHRGAGYMLWSALTTEQSVPSPADLEPQDIEDMVYRAYSNSGTV